VQVNKANSKYTFGHEVVHVIGGRHQQSSVYPDGDNTPGYAHGWNWKPNFFSKRRTTLMHVLKGKWKRQRELSNPSVHGREDLNDNARMMRENACRVAGFVDASPMEASMTGPFTLPLYSSGTWCAEVKFCNDVTVNWEYSTDGWNYYFAGTGICITRYIFTAQLHLRATVNCSTGETLTLYRTVRLPEDGANLNRSSSLVSSVLSSTIPSPKWHVFPNPSTSILNIHYLSTKFARAEIWLTDMMGRKRQLHHAVDQKGPIQLSFSTNHYAAGIYLLTLIDGHETFKQTIIIQAP
ncbi:MAG: T9SS type A sorting domain-containing protein, partial [Bacteroidota bacterium]